MKYLKSFKESKLYQPLDETTNKSLNHDNFTEMEISKIKGSTSYLVGSFLSWSNYFKSDQHTIFIYDSPPPADPIAKIEKFEDEWFIFTLFVQKQDETYQCDSFEGVLELIEDKLNTI